MLFLQFHCIKLIRGKQSHADSESGDSTARVISLFGLVFLLSRNTTCTHRPQGVIIVGIYMSSNIYYLLLLYLIRKQLCR